MPNFTYCFTTNVPPALCLVWFAHSQPLPARWNVTLVPVFVILQSRIHSTPVTSAGLSAARRLRNCPLISAHAFDAASSEIITRRSESPTAPRIGAFAAGGCGGGDSGPFVHPPITAKPSITSATFII